MRSFASRIDRVARRDLACGLLFSTVALAGFFDLYTNPQLLDSLGRGPDPGPALLPLVILSLIMFGGVLLLLKGMAGWASKRRSPAERQTPDAAFSRHAHAAALLASLLVLPSVESWLGFMVAAWLFAAPWLVWLEYRRHAKRRALLVGITMAAMLALSLHLIFITLLGVAL
ncbi:tripartite tricarboxylate transporter TctB family protein [Halomonas sp. GD1P12]|uniref:tripartite tricarboxylate transporter TctB family protein n=1 Tax=Halomonas sp. GD1P12 TaxID=2982691 RepID=UPI0021E4A23D|nr:tripartite tricarboxylate transporter TctB family protein [Halomonas sp. GD1P12]UYF99626.1 tripartite tricarboxylate transporter TctB family protein [Halomonas sp. GD1P12]